MTAAFPSFVVDDAELEQLERRFAAARQAAPAVVAELAWHLRQRDGARALRLVAQAREGLGTSVDQNARLALRLALVEAEVHLGYAEYDKVRALLDRAVADATGLGDRCAGADAHWLLSALGSDVGDSALRDDSLVACETLAIAADDEQRTLVAQGAMARWAVFTDPHAARAQWSARFGDGSGPWPVGVPTWVHDFLGQLAFSDGDFAAATMHRLRTQDDAVATGQWQRVVVALINIGAAFSNLNDHETGLAWTQRALDEARRLDRPVSIAISLVQLGGMLLALGRLESARDLVMEALALPAVLPTSRNRLVALSYLGDVFNRTGAHAQALEALTEMETLAAALRQSDVLVEARLAQASSIAALGRLDEALALAEATLVLCRQQRRVGLEVNCLVMLADLHTRRAEAEPGAVPAQAALACLREALALADGISGYRVSDALYDALAREYARAGDYRAAYDAARQAAQARDDTVNTSALNRSIALQITLQTERARAEAERHREFATALQQTTSTLEHLGAIGQEITRHLDEAAVFDVLREHVHGLLDADHLSIWLMEPDGATLRMAFGVSHGKAMPQQVSVALDATWSNVARCARTREEIVRGVALAGPNPSHIPGTRVSESALFAPLAVGERLLGVMSIQSARRDAYGERERLVLRTLCAYGAIGLDNAQAYRRLGDALGELQRARDELAGKNAELEIAWRQQQQASLTDPLTQLRNRRFLLDHIDDEIALTLRRQGTEDADLAFLMVDIDHFKEINDRHGHAAGDKVLVEVARRLRAVLRETDYLIRWGGEEFLVVARATDVAAVAVLAERLRLAIAGERFDIGGDTPLARTCSIGFAGFPFQHGEPRLVSWSEVVELADEALYLAKKQGRNCWVGVQAGAGVTDRAAFEIVWRDPEGAIAGGQLVMLSGR